MNSSLINGSRFKYCIHYLSVIVLILFSNVNFSSADPTPTPHPLTSDSFYEGATADKVVQFTRDILYSISMMDAAWPDKPAETDFSTNDLIGGLMLELLNSNKFLEKSEISMSKYHNDPNEVIRVASDGITTGCRLARAANNKYIDVLKNLESLTKTKNPTGELRLATAEYVSEKRDAYITATMGASLVLTLMWVAPKTPGDAHGKIPWRISDEQRKSLIQEIERKFGKQIKQVRLDIKNKTNSYAVISVMMSNFLEKLSVDTYEEAARTESQ